MQLFINSVYLIMLLNMPKELYLEEQVPLFIYLLLHLMYTPVSTVYNIRRSHPITEIYKYEYTFVYLILSLY